MFRLSRTTLMIIATTCITSAFAFVKSPVLALPIAEMEEVQQSQLRCNVVNEHLDLVAGSHLERGANVEHSYADLIVDGDREINTIEWDRLAVPTPDGLWLAMGSGSVLDFNCGGDQRRWWVEQILRSTSLEGIPIWGMPRAFRPTELGGTYSWPPEASCYGLHKAPYLRNHSIPDWIDGNATAVELMRRTWDSTSGYHFEWTIIPGAHRIFTRNGKFDAWLTDVVYCKDPISPFSGVIPHAQMHDMTFDPNWRNFVSDGDLLIKWISLPNVSVMIP